ncbi:MAG: DUF58 domain-containing protein [Candidatus Omnitrophica bacterium]|nr:DUF58 domain-containing protein [Candidatus Omnitrophota bacterium]
MIPKEVLKQVRRIQITTSRMVTDVFGGQYHSVFKGRGMEFDEVRAYQPGDDVRSIDWNVTARMGHPYIKKFVEEREMTVMLVLDVSASCRFGSTNKLKSELAAELCSVLALSAIKNNDKVGLIIFSDRIEKFIPPRKGLGHVLRVIREALYFKPQGKGTDINMALDYLNRVIKRKSVCFLISDFFAPDFKRSLTVANKRHDIVAISITDIREMELASVGLLCLRDFETDSVLTVDTNNKKIINKYKQQAYQRINERKRLLRLSGVDMIDVRSDNPYEKELIKFFRIREKRLS